MTYLEVYQELVTSRLHKAKVLAVWRSTPATLRLQQGCTCQRLSSPVAPTKAGGFVNSSWVYFPSFLGWPLATLFQMVNATVSIWCSSLKARKIHPRKGPWWVGLPQRCSLAKPMRTARRKRPRDTIDTATAYNNLACCLAALDRPVEVGFGSWTWKVIGPWSHLRINLSHKLKTCWKINMMHDVSWCIMIHILGTQKTYLFISFYNVD